MVNMDEARSQSPVALGEVEGTYRTPQSIMLDTCIARTRIALIGIDRDPTLGSLEHRSVRGHFLWKLRASSTDGTNVLDPLTLQGQSCVGMDSDAG